VPGVAFDGVGAAITIRASRSGLAPLDKVVIRSPSRLHPRIALTRPGDARVKAGGAIPLAEPELSPESLPLPRKAPSIISIRRASIFVTTLTFR
jgi:hypothetical protein